MTDENIPCEWDECPEVATHTVRIHLSDQPEEIWQVCRSHERELKKRAVCSRPKAPPPVEQTPTFQCRECDQILEDNTGACPGCGSFDRVIRASDTFTIHEDTTLTTRLPEKGRWLRQVKSGDDYTRRLEAWSTREQIVDREHGLYRKFLELYDGSRIESTASLRDHGR